MDEPELCAYCSEALDTNADAITKWFPDQKLMRKVHFHHLVIPKEKKIENIQFESTPAEKWWEIPDLEPEPDDLARLRKGNCGE